MNLEKLVATYYAIAKRHSENKRQENERYEKELDDAFTDEEWRAVIDVVYPRCKHENERGRVCSKCGHLR